MTSDAIWKLKQAVYDTLTGDATLMALVDGVYDYVPEGSPYPYVTITEARASDWSTVTTRGMRVDLTVQVYCRERGTKTCLEIMARIHTLLHDSNPTLTGHTLVNFRFETSEIRLRPDGLTYQGMNNFRAMIEED